MAWALTLLMATSTSSAALSSLGDALSEVIEAERERLRVPGAVLLLVDRSGFEYARGFGVESLESDVAIDPQTTAFRVASLSKQITGAAIGRLIREGRAKLDDTIALERPVTLEMLLHHTAGLDSRGIGVAVRRVEDLEPLERHLARFRPPIVRPPGTTASYSNYGFAILGRFLEERTGLPFAEAVRRSVLDPLEMNATTFEQPPPRAIAVATGYREVSGRLVALEPELLLDAPAGAMITTAADMSRWLRMMLREGAHDEEVFLSRELLEQAVGASSSERFEAGGTTRGFSSLLVAVPDGIGLFFSATRATAELRERVRAVFLSQVVPEWRGPRSIRSGAPPGWYRSVRCSVKGIEKLQAIAGDRRVGKNSEVHGENVSWHDSAEGGVLIIDGEEFVPLPYFETTPFQGALAGLCLLLLAAGAVNRDARRWALLLLALHGAALLAIGWTLGRLDRENALELMFGLPLGLRAALLCPWLALIATAGAAVQATRRSRFPLGLVAAASAALLAQEHYWNVLGGSGP